MTNLAQQLTQRLKRTPTATEASPPLIERRNEEAYQKVVALANEAADRNKGAILITLSLQADNFQISNRVYNYSAKDVVERLEKEGFEVQEEEDVVDAIYYKVIWDEDYPVDPAKSVYIRL